MKKIVKKTVVKKPMKKAQDGYTTRVNTFPGSATTPKKVTTIKEGTRPTGGTDYRTSKTVTDTRGGANKYMGKELYNKFENPKAGVNDTLSSKKIRYSPAANYSGRELPYLEKHNYSIKRAGGVENVKSVTPTKGGAPVVTKTFTKSKSGGKIKAKSGGKMGKCKGGC